MSTKKIGIAAASLAAIAALALGGSAIANAADNPTPSTTTESAAASPGTQNQNQGQSGQVKGQRGQGQQGAAGVNGQQGPMGSQDTPVTGDEAAKVSAAVTAKDSSVTVDSVRKDPDGSYDVLGTKAGAPVFFDVSADLATITENTGGPQGGMGAPGGHGASQDTPVTGDEAVKVSAAVTAKDSSVTVESVRKDPDGSYDVLGTKAGAPVFFDVSADLATITENTGGPRGGMGGPGGHQGAPGAPGATQQAPAATSSN